MATISITRKIKINAQTRTKILNTQPTENLKNLLESVKEKDTPTIKKENKLIAKYI